MRVSVTTVAAGACVLAAGARAAPFDIEFQPLAEPTESQSALLGEAESFWEGIVLGYPGGADIGALTIEVGAFEEDGMGGILATADVLDTVEVGGFVLPTYGFVDFDVDDLEPLERSGELRDTLVHEVAHVMGFGTLWVENGLHVEGSGRYTGNNALAIYRREFDAFAEFIPVDVDGGPGTQDVHWAEDWAGGPSELMTGFTDPDEFVSATTIASFRDLGYRTVAPIPTPASLPLALGGLALMSMAGRRGAAPRAG